MFTTICPISLLLFLNVCFLSNLKTTTIFGARLDDSVATQQTVSSWCLPNNLHRVRLTAGRQVTKAKEKKNVRNA